MLDKSVIDAIVHGRVEPHIYAFLTRNTPRFVKVGDTYRPVRVRIQEWRDKGFKIKEEDVKWWSAVLKDGVFFRDYSVHHYLEKVAHMERLSPEQLKVLPRDDEEKGSASPYSNEFFRYVPDTKPEKDIDSASKNVGCAVDDIRRYYGHKEKSQLQYTVYDLTTAQKSDGSKPVEKKPRELQDRAIKKFVAATRDIPRKGKKLLMYAVMRFGKTFTSLCCAVKMDARLVVVVSAKKDVGREWEDEVKGTSNFAQYEFLNAVDLKRNDSVISQIKTRKKRFVVFLTLHSFLRKKDWLEQLFKRKIDLLLVDETHFGARSEILGRVIKDQTVFDKKINSDIDTDDDAGERDSSEKEKAALDQLSLDARVTLHLSGTPYRILMKGEFPKQDIIAFCQYTDIIDAQTSWDRAHLGKVDPRTQEEWAEWDNPYFGFPQMVRFAFNPNPAAKALLKSIRASGKTCSFSEIFKPEIDKNGIFTGQFVHRAEVEEFVRILDGSDEGESEGVLSLLAYPGIQEKKLCQHVVIVLPYCASCDAFANLLSSGKYKTLGAYHVLNISGHNRAAKYDDPSAVKKDIRDFAGKGEKTITLTVNRLLTGSTVPEWDTMIFLKETKSPQEYDQAIFRLQNPYVQTVSSQKDGAGIVRVVKRNLKPQTLLVDFNPERMFRMQELRGVVYNTNVGDNGLAMLRERIKKELEISPVIFCNKDKLKQAEAQDLINLLVAYSGTRGVSEEVLELAVDLDSLEEYPKLLALIEGENKLDSKNGLEADANKGLGDDYKGDRDNSSGKKNDDDDDDRGGEDEEDKLNKERASRFRAYYRRVLFYVFLARKKPGTEIETVDDVIASISGAENERIARNMKVRVQDLRLLKKVKNSVLLQFECSIRRMSMLSHDANMDDPLERASIAMRKFDRLGPAEIKTPENIANEMVALLPAEELKRIAADGERILDISGKVGEFAIALYKRYRQIDPKIDVSNLILTIPTSSHAYEFTRKVYEALGLNLNNIAEQFTALDLIEEKNGKIDYEHIKNLLTQTKHFNKITMSDKVTSKGKHKTIAAVIGNPPYQEGDGGNKASAVPLYQKLYFSGMALKPSVMSLIIPAKWYTGGRKVLDDFRASMLNNRQLAKLIDFPNSEECFPGVDVAGGVCYFLCDSNHNGLCDVGVSISGKTTYKTRMLNEYETFVRYHDALGIVKKVRAICEPTYVDHVSSQKPFGLRTYVKPTETGDIKLRYSGGLGPFKRKDVLAMPEWIDKYKVSMSYLTYDHAGRPDKDGKRRIFSTMDLLPPGVVCTETYIVVGVFDTRKEAENLQLYLKTRFVRFLVALVATTQHISKASFSFVPLQDFTQEWTDAKLYAKYGITEPEQKFIESMIKPME